MRNRRRRAADSSGIPARAPSRAAVAAVLILLALVVLPFASPFAVGIHAGGTMPPEQHHPRRQQREQGLASSSLTATDASVQPSSPLTRTTAGARSKSTVLGMRASSSFTVGDGGEKAGDATSAGARSAKGNGDDGGVVVGGDNEEDDEGTIHGEHESTIPSRLLFKYASPLLDRAGRRQLGPGDAPSLPECQRMDAAVPKLEAVYAKCRSKARRRLEDIKARGENVWDVKERVAKSKSLTLAKSLLMHQKETLILTGILRFLNTAIQAFPALLVARLLRLIETGDAHHPAKSLRAALALVSVLTLKMIVENQYFHNVVKCATLVRGSLAGMIFDKSLRLPSGGGARPSSKDEKGGKSEKKGGIAAGEVLNLMQSDTSILESTAMQLHTIWDGPLQIAIYTTLLFKYLGPSVLWGMSVLLLTIPMNSVTLRLLNRMSRKENEAKDARTKRTTEAISNMKLLKLQGWEDNFADDIKHHRKEELRRHVSRGVVRAINQAISNAAPAIVLAVTLAAYARTGRPFVASTVFTSISLFNQLRFPLFFYPMLIDSLANGKNALRRIASYLSADEISPYVERFPSIAGQGGSIEMKNGNFLWSTSEAGENSTVAVPALCGAELSIKPGEVVAVVGPVGAGKTALVKGLLGELSPVPRTVVDRSTTHSQSDAPSMEIPTVVTHGPVAYCAQEAWLPKGSIRDAIVFGRSYNEERYMAAIRDAGLDADMIDDSEGVSAKIAASRGMLTHDTDVGEGGSSLSGGQRARVALARALYEEDAGVYLLDDPLSALDASVGSMVFERVTARLRKANSATVFVTNDPSLPRRCDRVVLMGAYDESGSKTCAQIVDVGTYDELIARGHDLRNIAVDHNIEIDRFDEESAVAEVNGHSEEKQEKLDLMVSERTSHSIHVVGGYDASTNDTIQTCHADPDCQVVLEQDPDYLADHIVPQKAEYIEVEEIDAANVLTKLDAEERVKTEISNEKSRPDPTVKRKEEVSSIDDVMTTGAVPRSVYMTYLKSVKSKSLVAAMLLSYLFATGTQFFQQYTVAKWTEIGSGSIALALGGKYLRSLVYAACAVSVFLWLRSFLIMRVGVNASEHLHSTMLSSIIKAPMSFFDATPSGQLLSRFGKEMETVDRALPDGISSVLFCFLQIILSGAALTGVVTPAMLIPLGILGRMYSGTMSRFRPAARDLKRNESKSRSPIYTHFGEALRGAETIRSVPIGRASWSAQHRRFSDENLSVFSAVKVLDRWLSIRLETLGNGVVLSAAVASVFLSRAGRLKSGSAGWGLTQALSVTGLLTWAVRTLTDMETQMMSVLRITEVTNLDATRTSENLAGGHESIQPHRKMPQEKGGVGDALLSLPCSSSLKLPLTPKGDAALLQSGWPWKGGIQFKNISMRYNTVSPLVLRNVTLSVPAGSTLGVCGRTGSGKSSLLLTLFRLVEIEAGGSIEIDGVDTRSVGLRNLRRSLSVIPQDPVLFAGSVRYNLDATGNASDEDAWKALEAASPELARQFRNSGIGLDTMISEGGKNLSLGQRQLMCLARALLRKSKILVLDEATSSVDQKTDAQVQETIRREFVNKGVTVITVAHRLDTIIGYDQIAVLGDGEVLEYGPPSELVRKSGGEFRKLVNADRRNKQKGAKASSVMVEV